MEAGEGIKIEVTEHEDEIIDIPDLVDPLSFQKVKSEFCCKICPEKFPHKLSLDIHEMLHDPNCYCFLCKMKKPRNFQNHVTNMHMNMICNICNKVFGFKKAFKLHQNSHTKETLHKCDQCDKSFMQRGSLRTHQHSAHEGRKLKCKICDGTFITSSSLRRHLRNMHSIQNILYCRICLAEFSNEKTRNDHESGHTKSKVCQECGVKFEKISTLTEHLTTEHFRMEKCQYCEKVFHQLKLPAHISAVHIPKECSVCNMTFYNKRDFKLHCLSHSSKKVTCKICHKKFKESFMERHEQQHNQNEIKQCNICRKFLINMEKHDALLHKNGDDYICRYCPRKFSTKTSLREHSLKGHRKRNAKFTCKICSQVFHSRYNLQRHYVNHNAFRPYKCDECLTQFKQPIYLRRHKATHAEKKFKCETCFRKYRSEKTLLRHKCPGDNVTCIVCTLKFGNKNNLKQHQLTLHSPRTDNFIKPKHKNRLEQHFHINSLRNLNIIKTNCKKKYQCTKCKIVFAILNNFKRHLCTQFVKKNYCVKCQRMFQTKQDWIRHVKLKHRNVDLRCKLCGLICGTSSGLRSHYGSVHRKKTVETTGSNVNHVFEGKTELDVKIRDTDDKIANLQNTDIVKIANVKEEVMGNSSVKLENEILFKQEFIPE